jgi:hypothetical protein
MAGNEALAWRALHAGAKAVFRLPATVPISSQWT